MLFLEDLHHYNKPPIISESHFSSVCNYARLLSANIVRSAPLGVQRSLKGDSGVVNLSFHLVAPARTSDGMTIPNPSEGVLFIASSLSRRTLLQSSLIPVAWCNIFRTHLGTGSNGGALNWCSSRVEKEAMLELCDVLGGSVDRGRSSWSFSAASSLADPRRPEFMGDTNADLAHVSAPFVGLLRCVWYKLWARNRNASESSLRRDIKMESL